MKFFDINTLVERVRANDDIMHKIREYTKHEYTNEYRWTIEKHTPEEIKSMHIKNITKECIAFHIYQDIIHNVLNGDMKYGPHYDPDGIKMLVNTSVDLMCLLLKPGYSGYSWAKKYKRFMIIWTGQQYMINDLKAVECTRVESLLDNPAHYLLYPNKNKLEIETAVKNAHELMDRKHTSVARAIAYYAALQDMMDYNPVFKFDRVDNLIKLIACEPADEKEVQHDNV